MKTTLETDDELYREAKTVASLTGRKVKDLLTDGLRWAVRSKAAKPYVAAARKLAACFSEADALMRKAPSGVSAREHLDDERNRLKKA